MNDLSTGNFAACVGWSGDVVQLARDNPAVKFVIPESGGTAWADTMVLPKGATNRDAAAKWMDFVYDPVQAAQITAFVQYISPVAGVQEELAKLDPDLAAEPVAVPRRGDHLPDAHLRQPVRGRRSAVRRRVLGDHGRLTRRDRRPDRVRRQHDDRHDRVRAGHTVGARSTRVGSGTSWWQRHPQRIGLGSLILSGVLLIAVGTGLLDGPLAIAALFVVLVAIVAVIMVAVMGGLDTRRALAPYGLLNPGMLWLALFYLAPLFTLLRNSLSTLPSRFAIDAEVRLELRQLRRRVHATSRTSSCGRSSTRASPPSCTIAIGYPLAYVIAFRGGKYRNFLIGLVIIPFFTSYLIRTIAWQSMLADQGAVTSFLRTIHVTGFLDTIGIMDGDKLLNTPAAVIGGLTYNFLPFMILPIYVSLEKIDVAPRRGGQGPVLDVDRRLPQDRVPAVAPRSVRRHAAHVHPGERRLRQPALPRQSEHDDDRQLDPGPVPRAEQRARWRRRCRSCSWRSSPLFVLIYSRFFGTDDLV